MELAGLVGLVSFEVELGIEMLTVVNPLSGNDTSVSWSVLTTAGPGFSISIKAIE